MKLTLSILLLFVIGFSANAQLDSDIEVMIESDSSSYVSCRNVSIKAQLINKADHVKHIFPELLENSVLALTVYNEKGERIPTVPPGVPKNGPFVEIQPMESLDLSYTLNMFSPELPKGKYSIRMNQFVSNELHIVIE